MAAEGAAVVIVDRLESSDRARAIVSNISAMGVPVRFEPADVTRPGEVAAVIARISEELGIPDAIVAAAGVSRHPDQRDFRQLLHLDPAHWVFVVAVNLTGTFLTCREAAAAMIESGQSGTIVTLASVAARIPTTGAYSVSKAGVVMLTRALALELAPAGIRVNAVAPGYIRTPMLEDVVGMGDPSEVPAALEAWARRVPMGRVGTPEEVAKTVVFLSGDESSYSTGGVLYTDGGYATRCAE